MKIDLKIELSLDITCCTAAATIDTSHKVILKKKKNRCLCCSILRPQRRREYLSSATVFIIHEDTQEVPCIPANVLGPSPCLQLPKSL